MLCDVWNHGRVDCRKEITGDMLGHGWSGVECLLYNPDAAHNSSDSLSKTSTTTAHFL